jgi:hypothetical protein
MPTNEAEDKGKERSALGSSSTEAAKEMSTGHNRAVSLAIFTAVEFLISCRGIFLFAQDNSGWARLGGCVCFAGEKGGLEDPFEPQNVPLRLGLPIPNPPHDRKGFRYAAPSYDSWHQSHGSWLGCAFGASTLADYPRYV